MQLSLSQIAWNSVLVPSLKATGTVAIFLIGGEFLDEWLVLLSMIFISKCNFALSAFNFTVVFEFNFTVVFEFNVFEFNFTVVFEFNVFEFNLSVVFEFNVFEFNFTVVFEWIFGVVSECSLAVPESTFAVLECKWTHWLAVVGYSPDVFEFSSCVALARDVLAIMAWICNYERKKK